MAYTITEECISCGACETECNNEAISEGEETYVIDPVSCSECIGNFESPKCAETCLVGAPVPDLHHAESWEGLACMLSGTGYSGAKTSALIQIMGWRP
jgi:ferredoxin